jgi:predicted dinucleotide-binding enzyme
MAKHNISKRRFIKRMLLTSAAGALLPLSGAPQILAQSSTPLKIGIIGSGNIGGSVGLRWAEAGHQILFSSRNPDQLSDLVQQAGPNARAGTPAEAAEFGDVILIAVPYGATPQVGGDYSPLMQGKVVIDCGNPRADRDGPMADAAIANGTGVASAGYFPGVRLVRAFNAVSYIMVQNEAHRDGELIGIPIAGDDAAAVAITVQLVRDAGFDPVVVGDLSRAREFDRGTDVYVRGMTAAQLRSALNLSN